MKAIVTGHSRGLGAALAAELLARGIAVLGLARSGNAELKARHPGLLAQQQVDLADPGALARWLEGAGLQRFIAGSSGVLLVNNAGIVEPIGPLPAQDAAAVARAVGLNVAAPLMLAAALSAAVEKGADTRIMHISSGAARNAYPGWSIYCATKAALDQHACAALLDRVPGLRICSMAPGIIDTDMQAAIRATSLERFPLRERFDSLKRDGQLASPAQCAQKLVAYLLDARFGDTAVGDLRDLDA